MVGVGKSSAENSEVLPEDETDLEDEEAVEDEKDSSDDDDENEEDAESDVNESDQGESDDVDDEPSSLSDRPGAPLYKEGLRLLAENLAGKHGDAYPYLKATTTGSNTTPSSTAAGRSGPSSAPASCAMLNMVQAMDAIFLSQHGSDIDRKPGVLKRYK